MEQGEGERENKEWMENEGLTEDQEETICRACEGPLDKNPSISTNDPLPERVVALRCGHAFHNVCIQGWWDRCTEKDE